MRRTEAKRPASSRVWTLWQGGAATWYMDLDPEVTPWGDLLELELVLVRGQTWAMWMLVSTGALLWLAPAGLA